jgi:hypothetical protein
MGSSYVSNKLKFFLNPLNQVLKPIDYVEWEEKCEQVKQVNSVA